MPKTRSRRGSRELSLGVNASVLLHTGYRFLEVSRHLAGREAAEAIGSLRINIILRRLHQRQTASPRSHLESIIDHELSSASGELERSLRHVSVDYVTDKHCRRDEGGDTPVGFIESLPWSIDACVGRSERMRYTKSPLTLS